MNTRLAVSLVTALALAAFACSSAPPDTGTGTGTGTKTKTPSGSSTSQSPTDPSSPTNPTTPTTPTTPLTDTAACGMKATSKECSDCCVQKTPTALDASDKIYGDCICAATTCATACVDSVCAMADNTNTPTAACKTCLDTNDQMCGDKAGAACDADATCKAASACLQTACDPIAAKENPTP